MGNLFSIDHVIDEQAVATYSELTYLRKCEIRHIATLLDEVDPGKLRGDLHHRFTLEQIDKILPEIQCSPFRDSIYRVFSSKKDGYLSLEDVLDLCSAFSENSFEDARAAWAFYIFDFDGDNQISLNDLIEAVQMLTRNEQTECGSIDRAAAEHVARMVSFDNIYCHKLLAKNNGHGIGSAPSVIDYNRNARIYYGVVPYFRKWCSVERERFRPRNSYVSCPGFLNSHRCFVLDFNYADDRINGTVIIALTFINITLLCIFISYARA